LGPGGNRKSHRLSPEDTVLESEPKVEDNDGMVTLDRLQRQRTEIVLLGEKYGARNIRVFGSVARGDNRQESDVDFLVDMDKGRTLFDLAGFVADVQDLLGVKVDVVTPGGLRYLREQVLSEAVSL
jgi:predicted nucleotidyltransferase